MEAKPARARLPTVACGMLSKTSVECPGFACIAAYPQAGRINTGIYCLWLVCSTWLNHPDIREFQAAIRCKLNATLRLLPCLPKIITVAYERTEEIAISGGKQAMPFTLIEDGVENALPNQS